jgi:parallel beta-helix repeat protein
MERKIGIRTAVMIGMLLISMLLMTRIPNVKASGTIYIRANGSIDPPTARISSVDNITYTLMDNIYDYIVVERDNIVLDGVEHVIQVATVFEAKAIDLSGRTNVTVRNVEIDDLGTWEGGGVLCYCIYLSGSSNNRILGNRILNSTGGIWLDSSSNNDISQNNITRIWYGVGLYWSSNNSISMNNIDICDQAGIRLWGSSSNNISSNNITQSLNLGISLEYSSDNQLRDNSMSGNSYNFGVSGTAFSDFLNDVDVSNTVDDQPVYYWINRQDTTVTGDPGCVVLVNCTRTVVQELNPSHNLNGILLAFTENSTITKNTITHCSVGVGLASSSNNSINDNSMTHCSVGVGLASSPNNTVSDNSITDGLGIELKSSSNFNGICRNVAPGGICLIGSSYNDVINNSMVGGDLFEIGLSESSHNNCISENTIANSSWGIHLENSSNNIIYHNNFINNTCQVFNYISTNVWDDGYPNGGNCWSDYTGADVKNGPNQNQPGSDGIGDTAYVIDGSNQDNYPLMSPWTPPSGHDVAIVSVVAAKAVIGQGFSGNIAVYGVNRGGHSEAFNVTVYANATLINSTSLLLDGGLTADITFTWNTSSFAEGNYTISAYVAPVPNETNLANNNCTGGSVTVSIAGDVTGPNGFPDGQVNLMDVYRVAMQFGSNAPTWDPYWGPVCDINNDGTVNLIDYYRTCMNFGQTIP